MVGAWHLERYARPSQRAVCVCQPCHDGYIARRYADLHDCLMTYREHVANFKRRLFSEAIRQHGVAGAARELDIDRTHLHRLLNELDIHPVSPFSRNLGDKLPPE